MIKEETSYEMIVAGRSKNGSSWVQSFKNIPDAQNYYDMLRNMPDMDYVQMVFQSVEKRIISDTRIP